jgi:hypothetical protein
MYKISTPLKHGISLSTSIAIGNIFSLENIMHITKMNDNKMDSTIAGSMNAHS